MPISKETVGEDRYRELKHAAYLRRKARLEKAAELEELEEIRKAPDSFGENASRSRVCLFFLGLKLGMKLALTKNRREQLKEGQAEQIDLWAMDMTQRIVQDDWDLQKIQTRHVRMINETPRTQEETKFYRIVESALNQDEADVWDFVYWLLNEADPDQEKHSTAYIIEYETGVAQEKVYATLINLKKRNIIDFRDDTSNPHVMSCQPVWIKRGADWINE